MRLWPAVRGAKRSQSRERKFYTETYDQSFSIAIIALITYLTDEFRTIRRVKSRVTRSLKELAITTTTASPTSLTVPKFLLISSTGHDSRITSIRPLIKVVRTGFFTEVGLGKEVVLIGLGNP